MYVHYIYEDQRFENRNIFHVVLRNVICVLKFYMRIDKVIDMIDMIDTNMIMQIHYIGVCRIINNSMRYKYLCGKRSCVFNMCK